MNVVVTERRLKTRCLDEEVEIMGKGNERLSCYISADLSRTSRELEDGCAMNRCQALSDGRAYSDVWSRSFPWRISRHGLMDKHRDRAGHLLEQSNSSMAKRPKHGL